MSVKNNLYLTILIISIFAGITAKATDDTSRQVYEKGLKLMQEKKYKDAAEEFKNAKLLANSYQLKANAVKKAAEAYQKGKLYYQEFQCIEVLLDNYPSTLDVDALVHREYEIANMYYKGYREHPYWWAPWIEDDDKGIEIYEAILDRSPYASFVPDMLLKLGLLYIKEEDNWKAIEIYKELIDKYPNDKATKYAYLDLANIYLQYSQSADGDGSNTENARQLLLQFKKKYPKAIETKWVDVSIKRAYDLEAKHLYDLAMFYNRKDNAKASKRYLQDILVNYPDSSYYNKAEEAIEKVDLMLYPMNRKPEKEEKSDYDMFNLPAGAEEDSVLIISENSSGKWLRPVNNAGVHEEKLLQEKYKGAFN